MYYNFSRLTKKSLNIAMAIINVILSILLIIWGSNYEGRILVGFIILAFGFLSMATSSAITFVIYNKFGESNGEPKQPTNAEDKKSFDKLTNINSIFATIFFLLLITGIIVILV